MTRSVSALYDSRTEAEVAKARLSAEARVDDVRIFDQRNVGALRDLQLSETDLRTYTDGLQRGGALLSARVDGADAERIIRLLEESVRRTPTGHAEPVASSGQGSTGQSVRPATMLEETHIPVVEEELRIGKRTVVRGGATVHTRVREVPVSEDVELKQEHVHVDGRPSGRSLTDEELIAGGVLKPRVVEISEMREEAVVTKSAFVREEVVLSKTVERRIETITDTIRRTEVDVDQYEGSTGPPVTPGQIGGRGRP